MKNAVFQDDTETIVGNLVEIRLVKPDNFLMIAETLTRMGMADEESKSLTQTCHILKKRDRFYLVHYKELKLLDGDSVELKENDIAQRNTIANQISAWGFVELVVPEKSQEPLLKRRKDLTIIRYGQKNEWHLVAKYVIGKKDKTHD